MSFVEICSLLDTRSRVFIAVEVERYIIQTQICGPCFQTIMGNNFSPSPYLSSDDEYETPPSTRPSSPAPEDPIQALAVTIPEPEPELPLSIFSGVEAVAPTECPTASDFNFLPLSLAKGVTGFIAYTLNVTDERVCFFTASSYNIIERSRDEISLTDLVKGEIYHVAYLTYIKMGPWSSLSAQTRRKYIERSAFVCENLAAYRQLILPALLVGWRVRDYEQRCATVVQMGELRLSMTSQKGKWLERLKLKTSSGEIFMVAVTAVIKHEDDKRWTVVCLELQKLPSTVRQGCHLEIVDEDNIWQSPVPSALFSFFSTTKTASTARPIDNWPLLDRIYGAPSHCILPCVPITDYSFRLSNGGTIKLNPQQTEAVARYNTPSILGFAIEAPPGSGKTMTAAAMAVSYNRNGVQLFLSTANIAVNNMALSLGKLDIGTRSPLHLMSSEGREKLAEQAESPYSALSLAKNQDELRVKIEEIENRTIEKGMHEQEQRKEQRDDIFEVCKPILDTPHDIYFATIDTILKRMTKPNKDGYLHEDTIKRQLESEVERIVIDEASQLTEAALNALILHFPKAQIVLIGDSKQLSPFKYTSGETVSELGHRSSIDVVKDKNNIPVIKLHEVYRASERLVAHYSDVFYDGKLKSKKNEVQNPLTCFGDRITSPRLFWKVKNGHGKQDGTSKINDREIETLVQIVTKLRESNITEKDVMIISYYEAQRKIAAKMLKKYWKGYEVLTVDSAQVSNVSFCGAIIWMRILFLKKSFSGSRKAHRHRAHNENIRSG